MQDTKDLNNRVRLMQDNTTRPFRRMRITRTVELLSINMELKKKKNFKYTIILNLIAINFGFNYFFFKINS